MQQLEVRRLSPSESAKERQEFFFDTCSTGSAEIPKSARVKWICQYLGKSDRTVKRYRDLLFEHCYEYQQITCINGIDNRILRRRQIELLKEFSDLVNIWNDIEFSLECYRVNHLHPLDIPENTTS